MGTKIWGILSLTGLMLFPIWWQEQGGGAEARFVIESPKKQSSNNNFQRTPSSVVHYVTDQDGHETLWVDGDNGKVAIEHTNNVKEVEFSQLLKFIKESDLDQGIYVEDSNDCVNFSHRLFNRAQTLGIKAKLVTIHYGRDDISDHMVVGFPTTDRGIVLVDFTPSLEKPSKKVVFAEPNHPQLSIPLSRIQATFSNQKSDFVNYQNINQQLETDLQNLSQDLDRRYQQLLSDQSKAQQASAFTRNDLSNKINQYNYDREKFNSMVQEYNTRGIQKNRHIVESIKISPKD